MRMILGCRAPYLRRAILCLASALSIAAPAAGQEIAASQRQELVAAQARVRASEQRPAIVGALEDPMVSASIDHKPFGMSGMDWSVTVEQRLPLGSLRRNRRESARAEIVRLRAEVEDRALGVALEAVSAFVMLQQRRRSADVPVLSE